MPDSPSATKSTWTADLLASFVVFMVALPLCIGIAQACGLPPEAGVFTGIVGGILVGSLAGSPLQVSGPAAGLIVLVIQFLEDARKAGHEGTAAIAMLGLAIMMAGALQITAGICRVGQWFRAVSPAVVEGMLAGIGITIIAKQFHALVDDDPPKEIVQGLITIPQAIWKAFYPPPGADANHREAALIGVLTFIVLLTWKSISPKKLRIIPSAVIGILLAVALNEFGRPLIEAIGMPIGPKVDDHGGIGVERVKVSSNLLDGLVIVSWPGWDVFGTALLWKAAITFALIASAETLLCAVAVDTMQSGPRTRFDKELIAQGVGNLVCGAAGALPMTGVIVRSSANVDAGAKTRLSAILHGVWLLVFVTALPGFLSRIPAAALAAVLVYTGWKLLGIPGLIHLWKERKSEALIFVATAVTIVATDLLAGVVLGVFLSAVKLLWLFSHLRVDRHDEPEHQRVHLHLEGAGTFVRLPLLAQALDRIPPKQRVHIHLDGLRLVDHAVLTLLQTFVKQYAATGGKVYLDHAELLARFHIAGGKKQVVPQPPVPESEPVAVAESRGI